ncbi:MAG: hypothetical protein JOS17DRAFT_495397 [Linnemannia elongata]|nr:MAG: hypothetical protein JOS17DRAFT_495397 [Linnemannia elongata]
MHTATMKVFAIPELLDIIGRFLDTTDRLHLSMTNQLCYQTINPLFWASLDLFDTVRAQRLLQSTDAQQAFNRSVFHIRQFKIQTSALVHVDSMTSQPNNNNATSAHTSIFDLEVTLPALPPSSTPDTTSTSTTLPTRQASSWLPESPPPNPLTFAIPRMTRLTNLEYKLERTREEYTVDTCTEISGLPQLTWLLTLNPLLTHVRLQGCDIQSAQGAFLFVKAITHPKALTELDLNFRSCTIRWGELAYTLFYCLPTSLETFRLDGSNVWDGTTSLTHYFKPQQTNPTGPIAEPLLVKREVALHRLKRLRVEFGCVGDTCLLSLFVKQCPALESFDPLSWGREESPPLSRILARAVAVQCPRLRVLESCGQGALDILKVFRHHTLEAVRDQSPNTKASCVVRLASGYHFNTLREIRLTNCGHISGDVVQEVLSMCTGLEHLVISGSGVSTRLKYLVKNEWVCGRLKTLEITVNMREVRTCAEGVVSMPMVRDTWIKLRKLYRQLGALTEIEVLHLGMKSMEMQWLDKDGKERSGDENEHDSWLERQSTEGGDWSVDDDDSNEFTRLRGNVDASNADASFPGLFSLGDELAGRPGYLKMLSGLTKLKELRGHVQANLGRRELEWMLAHWPKLEVFVLLPTFVDSSIVPKNPLIDVSPEDIAWLKQQRSSLSIQRGS